jgi:serine/threonine-protein kinase
LGRALVLKGRFAKARDATHRALDLLPERDRLRAQVAEQLQECERLLALDEKLLAIVKGDARPADTRERLQLADLCLRYKKRYAAAVRFYADAFTADPKLAADLNWQHRYNAACAAALAAAGKGEDAAKLDQKERDRWRKQALDWLQADLDAYTRLAEKGNTAARQPVAQRLAHWQKDADLSAVRDKKWLDAMPEADRRRWQQLWADVEALLKKVPDKQ